MKRFIIILIVVIAILVFTLIALWFSSYAVGWIGYLFDLNERNGYKASDIYVCFLIPVFWLLTVVAIMLLCKRKIRIYSLLIIPHLFPLFFAMVYAETKIFYIGYGYVQIRSHESLYSNPFLMPRIQNVMEGYPSSIIVDGSATYETTLRYDSDGQPWFFSWESDNMIIELWDLSGKETATHHGVKIVDYSKNIIGVIDSVTPGFYFESSSNDYLKPDFVNIEIDYYDRSGNYKMTKIYKDLLKDNESRSHSGLDYKHLTLDEIDENYILETDFIDSEQENLWKE